MPANTKYLSSKGQRVLKVTAGIFGGFALAMAMQMAVGAVIENKGVLVITSAYFSFFLWVLFMILAFLFRNGWKAWAVYLLGILVCSAIIYWGQNMSA